MGSALGVDIGGTGVRAAAIGRGGELGPVARRALVDRAPETVIATVVDLVRAHEGVTAVGVGVPGFVRGGVVMGSPNFPGWEGLDLASRLRAELGVAVENDANCACLGAWHERGGQEDLVLLTLGTGVGGGIVSRGQLLVGAGGTGAEVGHLFAGGDQPCGCGGIGCLETWCGTAGLARRAAALGHPGQDGVSLLAAAEAGEVWASELLHDAGLALGRGLVTLVNLFNPDAIGLAGGLCEARPYLEEPAMSWLKAHGVAPSVARAEVFWAGRADHLAILGAAAATRLEVR